MAQRWNGGYFSATPLPEKPRLSPREAHQEARFFLSVGFTQATADFIAVSGFSQDFFGYGKSDLQTRKPKVDKEGDGIQAQSALIAALR